MRPVTEKVLARLSYEKLLVVAETDPQRRPITFEEIIEAGKEEPRIYQTLPAILLHKPQIIKGLKENEKIHEKLKKQIDTGKTFYGISVNDYLKTAETFRQYLNQKKSGQKSLTVTFRMAPEDITILKELTRSLKTKSVSETIRILAREKKRDMLLSLGL